MRLNWPRIVLASVLTVNVFARPGTPSTSRWPCARIATSTRSRKVVLPDHDTLDLVEHALASAGDVPVALFVHGVIVPVVPLNRDIKRVGCRRRCRRPRWSRRSRCRRKCRPGRVENRGHDTDHLAVHRDERPARTARVGRGVELDQPGEQALSFGRAEFAVRGRRSRRPTRRADAEGKSHRDHLVARLQPLRRAERGRAADRRNLLRPH